MNDKKIHLSILAIFLAAALVDSVAALGANQVYAGENRNHHDKDNHDVDDYVKYSNKFTSNIAAQGLGQTAETYSSSSCDSGNDATASCNNVALSFNLNDGNNALGQQ